MEIAVPVVIVLVIILLGVVAVVAQATRQSRSAETSKAGTGAMLRYPVPPGQDAAAVVAALQQQGYDAASDPATTSDPMVVIQCPGGVDHDRPRIRAVLESAAPLNVEGDRDPTLNPVRFADE